MQVGIYAGTIVDLIPHSPQVIVRLDNERQIKIDLKLLLPTSPTHTEGACFMPKPALKIGDRVIYRLRTGTVTEILAETGQVIVKLDDGQVIQVSATVLNKGNAPTHKMVEGPRSGTGR